MISRTLRTRTPVRFRSSPALQGAPKITGAVQHTDDFRPVVQRAIKDDISPEGQAAQPWHELIAGPAQKRVCGEQFAMLLHALNEPRGDRRIVARNEVADFDKIALCAVGKA